jgi:DNA-binding XRE family transcriptional regulator
MKGGIQMPNIREIREKHYISRKVLAKASGVSESTIIRMEKGDKHVTEEVATNVLAALSARTGMKITINDVEGLNLYNPMRDRSYPTQYKKNEESAA